MVASFGPIPKREESRVRDTPPGEEITKIQMEGEVKVPNLAQFPGILTHLITRGFWESMKISGQAKYWEPTDWFTALTALHLLDKQLRPYKNKEGKLVEGQASPTMIAAIWQMLTSVAVTEGERRRLRIEVERKTASAGAEAKVIPFSDIVRNRFHEQKLEA